MKFTKVNICEAVAPNEGLHDIMLDRWWIVTGHGEILFTKSGSPQCSSSEQIAESIRSRVHPECHLQRLSAVYVPINPQDYC